MTGPITISLETVRAPDSYRCGWSTSMNGQMLASGVTEASSIVEAEQAALHEAQEQRPLQLMRIEAELMQGLRR